MPMMRPCTRCKTSKDYRSFPPGRKVCLKCRRELEPKQIAAPADVPFVPRAFNARSGFGEGIYLERSKKPLTSWWLDGAGFYTEARKQFADRLCHVQIDTKPRSADHA